MINLALSLVASVAVVLVCATMAVLLRNDRQEPPRHRPVRPMLALPAAPVRDPEPPRVFDPLDERTTLDEVERFLAELEDGRLLAAVVAEPTSELETVA